jgi:hypothetical protein
MIEISSSIKSFILRKNNPIVFNFGTCNTTHNRQTILIINFVLNDKRFSDRLLVGHYLLFAHVIIEVRRRFCSHHE